MAAAVDDKKIIYSMYRVSRTFGVKTVLKDISISYFYGAKIGVIGANGSGKSSLLKILAGVDRDYTGETSLAPGYSVGYLEQEPSLEPEKTVRDIVGEGVAETTALLGEFDAINEAFADPDADIGKLCEKQAAIQEKLDALDAWNLESRLEMAMDALRCPPGDQKAGVLSGGEKRRVALCRLLLQKPDILLLDEPTNHLDAETVAWLERHLQQYEGTVIAVTHDRYFLDNVAGWILELDRGEGIPFKGNYSAWLRQKEARLEREEKGESERRRALRRELDWINMTPKGRQAKHKEHITRYEQLLSASGKERMKDTRLAIPQGPRLGSLVIEGENLGKGYGDRLLFEGFSFKVKPGAVVGVVGPNGAGKTTLLRIIVGEETPDTGTLRVGDTVKLVYVDQMRSLLDPEKTVWEQLSGGLDVLKLGAADEGGRPLAGALREVNSRAYCAWFNFSGPDQQKKVGLLSGGERNRLNLALMLKQAGNVLLLDEPTNDLDVGTIRALEDAVEDFAGCVVAVSHDRWFLDRVCTHIIAFENDSRVFAFEGNWSEYAAWRKTQFGEDADRPRKTVYRKILR
ncbi:MAG: energy-dependent translational throttle protein EttA [Spirochaetaceae bacterium]|jgi:ATP-binding cassette ChvD family protein|nr:energy-dependent translational throttle protein EttA [Spirochaetaceae bacterium]